MAIRNDPRMFTGGAVVFDSSPTVAFAAQQEAKRQAKEEALNKYFEDQLKQLNTEGIRQVDLIDPEGKGRGIIDKINSWQQYWKENKNQILKGGVGRMDSDRMLQEIRQQIGEAKAAGKFFNDLGQAKFEGKYDPDDDELNVLHLASLPVYDPASRKQDGSRYGWSDLMPTIPEYDAKKQADVWSAITKGLQPGKVYDYNNLKINEKTGQAIVPFSEKYSLEQVKSIADNAASIAMSDKSVKKHFQKILNNPNSQEWQELNSAYQSVYGKNKVVSEPWQAAQADAILRASVPQKVGQEQEVNYAQRLADKQMMAAFNRALINSSRQSGSGQTERIDLTEYPDVDGKGKDITDLMQGVIVTGLPTGDKLLAEKVYYDPSTQKITYKEYAERDVKGNIVKGGSEKTVSLTTFMQNVKTNNPGTDMKFLGGLRNPIVNKPKQGGQNVKTYIVGGRSFTKEQMEAGAKKHGMPLDVYLKSIGVN